MKTKSIMLIEKEKLQKKYKKSTAALETLKEAINNIEDTKEIAKFIHKDPKKIYKTFRDSLIKRFDYTFDETWQYLSEYLQFEGQSLEIKTPKSIFRESLKAKVLSEEQVRLSIKMVNHRNLTTHGYDEELIEEISKNVPEYTNLLGDILQQTKIKP